MATPVVRSFHDQAMEIARTTVRNLIQNNSTKGARRRDPQYKGLPDNSTGSRNAPFFVCKSEAPFPVSSATPFARRMMEGAGNAGFLWNPEGRKYAKAILQRRAADIIAQQQMLPEQLELGEPDVTTGAIRSPFTGQLITADLTQLSPTTPGYQNIVDGIQALKLNMAEIMDIVGDSLPEEELAGAQETVGRPAAGDDEEKARRAMVERAFAGRDAWTDSRKLAALTSSLNVRISTLAPYLSADAMEELYAAVADVLTTLRHVNGKGASISNAIRRLSDARLYIERSAQWATLPLKDRVERNKQLQKEFDIVSGLPGRREKIPTQTEVPTVAEPAAPGTAAAVAAAARTVQAQQAEGATQQQQLIQAAAERYAEVIGQQISDQQKLVYIEKLLAGVNLVLKGRVPMPTNDKERNCVLTLTEYMPLSRSRPSVKSGTPHPIQPFKEDWKKTDLIIPRVISAYNAYDVDSMNTYIGRLYDIVNVEVNGTKPIEAKYGQAPKITMRSQLWKVVKDLLTSPAYGQVERKLSRAQQLSNAGTVRAIDDIQNASGMGLENVKTGNGAFVWWSSMFATVDGKIGALPADVMNAITGQGVPGGVGAAP